MKLESKEQNPDGRERRKYGEPATPFARVMAHALIRPEDKARLRVLKGKLNPFALEASIQKQLKAIDRVRRALE